MKIWTSEHVFDHPWETVVHAAWRKYPNPINPAVTGMDVLNRKVTENGVLQSERILQTQFNIPGWVTRLIGLTNPNYSHEFSEVDRNKREMTLKTINLNCTNFVSVDEKLTYKPHPQDPACRTVLEQETVVTVRGVPLIDYCEKLFLTTYETNAKKGRQGIEWVIGNIKREYEELSTKLSHEVAGLSDKLTSELRRSLDDMHAHESSRT
jgi:hypothetical protein